MVKIISNMGVRQLIRTILIVHYHLGGTIGAVSNRILYFVNNLCFDIVVPMNEISMATMRH